MAEGSGKRHRQKDALSHGSRPREARDARNRIAAIFRAVYDQDPHPGGILSLDGTVLNANRAACKLIGVEPSAVEGQPFWETPWWTHSAEEQQKLRAAIQQASRGEVVQFLTSHLVGGKLHVMDFTLRPARGDSGRLLCLIAEGRDITELIQAEEERRHHDSVMRSVFRATPIGITFNINRVIISVNDSMCALLGYSEREIVGHSARMFYDTQQEFERVGRELYLGLPQKGRASVETRFRRKDGAAIFVVLTAALLSAEDPEAGFVVTVQDISERKRAEEALRESEARFRNIIEQSPFAIQVLSPAGEIVEVNAAFRKLWGVSQESLRGYNMLRDEQIERLGFMPTVRRAFAGEQVSTPIVEYDASAAVGQGVRRVVQGIYYPIRDMNGQVRHIILVHLDLTDRTRTEEEKRRLQEQLQQAMKMEAVGRLAGGIAHDFNNLLTSILGNAELARLEAGSPGPLAQYLEEINEAAQSAASLTRQLLAFSRRQIIEPRVVDLNELVERLRRMLARLIGEDLELALALQRDLGAVRVDPGQFEQVLVNLAVNARDAMPHGGRLLLQTANVELEAEYCAKHPNLQPGKYVLLAVSDTGHGMSEEVKGRIFEPFFTTKPKGRGTGLGLATIFGIVKQAGGAIEIYSEVGLGTTFKIYLPLSEAPPEEQEAEKRAEAQPGRGETILLVEDDRGVLELARTMLRRLGYQVLCAAAADEALRIARSHGARIDLLLTDVVMPDMNGRELAGKLLSLQPQMKVLFTSGYTEDVILHLGVLEENLNYIGKPYSLQALSAKLREVLGGGPAG